MTCLHKFLWLPFIPANDQAKLAQQLILTMLPFHPVYFPWIIASPYFDLPTALKCFSTHLSTLSVLSVPMKKKL